MTTRTTRTRKRKRKKSPRKRRKRRALDVVATYVGIQIHRLVFVGIPWDRSGQRALSDADV